MKIPTRQDDELLLRMLRMRAQGASIRAIGGAVGVGFGSVERMTRNVRDVDIAQAPAHLRDRIAEAYW